ncbi:MAG: hypothetical protein HYZ14_03495 [Bacteroidetes bacterium]|nr:hypothetical protein [Bacteroidota bacterium]
MILLNLRTCFFGVTLLFLFSGFSQTDREEQNFQGAVKLVREKEYEVQFDTQQQLARIKMNHAVEFEFNETGNLINWADFYQNEMLSWYYHVDYAEDVLQKIETSYMNENFILSVSVFQYDAEGRELSWSMKNGSNETIYLWQHTYSKKGFRVRSESYRGSPDSLVVDRYYVYKNDKKGHRISEHWYTADGQCRKLIVNTFDKRGNVVKAWHYDGENNLTGKWIQAYNEKNQLVDVRHFKSETVMDSRSEYRYDDYGNELEIKVYNAADSLAATWRNTYQYDSLHNWTEKIRYYNDQPLTQTEREVFYFE